MLTRIMSRVVALLMWPTLPFGALLLDQTGEQRTHQSDVAATYANANGAAKVRLGIVTIQ